MLTLPACCIPLPLPAPAHEAKDLRMEMEDLGTTGDGDNKPEAFDKKWEVRVVSIYYLLFIIPVYQNVF